MAKLIALEEWRQRTFDEPRPSLRACQKWAKEGNIAGARQYGALWFVDPDVEKRTTGNPLVDRVLAH
ncbi:MAG: DNA-binding protein [Marinobacter sp.]|nr:DNA-binding protein [Marinobacter sp.]